MDPRKLMERLKGAAALTEQDVGEFSHFKGKMMKISVHNYAVEDLCTEEDIGGNPGGM